MDENLRACFNITGTALMKDCHPCSALVESSGDDMDCMHVYIVTRGE